MSIKSSFYALFFLCISLTTILKTFGSQPTIVPSLENLNAYYVTPATKVIFPPTTTIPTLFDNYKRRGVMPAAGTIEFKMNSNNPLWTFHKGLPKNLKIPLFIHSGPRGDFWGRMWHGQKGHALRSANPWIKNGIINSPLVTFDYYYGRDYFDFGQGINIQCLEFIYKQLIKDNQKAPVVIAATCIGAKITLEFLARNCVPEVKALILESPFIDSKRLIHNLEHHYGQWLPVDMKSIVKWYFKDVKNPLHLPHADLRTLKPNLPIFIAHLDNDAYYSNADMQRLIEQIQESGNRQIYLLVIKDPTIKHSHLSTKKVFAQATSAFLEAYGLPHNKKLAQEGRSLLNIAKQNARLPHTQWHIVHDT
jgi:hypothetical protein